MQERGCYPKNLLNLKCKVKCLDILVYLMLIPNKPPYCLARILSTHKDFFEQKSAIAMLIKGRGYKCIFILKFYYKLNPIKMY